MSMDETFLLQGLDPPAFDAEVLQVGAFQERSFVAGPGERAVVWVAGCLRRCPGCMKPDLFAFDVGRSIPVQELAAKILSIPGLTGVTFSGGEPFEQAAALGRLAKTVRAGGRMTQPGCSAMLPKSSLPPRLSRSSSRDRINSRANNRSYWI